MLAKKKLEIARQPFALDCEIFCLDTILRVIIFPEIFCVFLSRR